MYSAPGREDQQVCASGSWLLEKLCVFVSDLILRKLIMDLMESLCVLSFFVILMDTGQGSSKWYE